MIKKLVFLITLSVLLSGCYMKPLALITPAASNFTTASIFKSGMSTTANFLVKKSTGKSLGEHAYDALNMEVLQQAYFPKNTAVNSESKIAPQFNKN